MNIEIGMAFQTWAPFLTAREQTIRIPGLKEWDEVGIIRIPGHPYQIFFLQIYIL
jgi:hypothetical protein